MIKKEHVYLILALVHLGLVNLFIWTSYEDEDSSKWYSWLRVYRDFSGCFRDYSYFAPNVANDTRAIFITKTDSDTIQFLPFKVDNEVANIRYNNIISSGMRNPKARDLFAKSWATAIFGYDKSIHNVTVVTEAYIVPAMSDYKKGKRPSWEIIYAGSFEKQVE